MALTLLCLSTMKQSWVEVITTSCTEGGVDYSGKQMNCSGALIAVRLILWSSVNCVNSYYLPFLTSCSDALSAG